jgi:spore coat protein U-like protein
MIARLQWLRTASLLTLLLGPGVVPASAATKITTLAVMTIVAESCVVVARPLTFGTYDPARPGPTDGTATVSVICTGGTTYNVSLDAGTGGGATAAAREMRRDAHLLRYGLYSNSSRTEVCGDPSGTDTLSASPTGAPNDFKIYGRIPPRQAVPSGAYSGAVRITVTY